MEPVLIRQGFLHEDHLNYLISLNYPPEALFQNIGSRTRKHIRYGLKQNTVVIQEVRDELANLMNITGLASLCPEGGGALVNFGHNICIHSPLRLKLSKVGYQIMRKFM
jgi:hypothetical protein